MTTYAAYGPDAAGQYIIGYPTPGIPHVITAAFTASSPVVAADLVARLNESQTLVGSDAS